MTSIEQRQKYSIIADKKYTEIKSWFEEHFKTCLQTDYLRRSPFVILTGPTGSGKTTLLERIAEELNLSIKEYSETTDTNLIKFELKDIAFENSYNTTLRIDKHRSLVFESFVINNVRYEPLYADSKEDVDDAAAEFDNDDDFVMPPLLSQTRTKPMPKGVIIHIETPLSFGRSTKILIQCLRDLKKLIKHISIQVPRRVALVFESTDHNDYIMSLPANVRQSLDIETFKINPVTRLNMKKLIECELNNYNYRCYDKEVIEQLIDDCEGDASACKNTLRLLCRNGQSSNLNGIDGINKLNITPIQYSKRQKVEHGWGSRLQIHPNLLRDVSKGSGFFHILGKIFYQKRLYPVRSLGGCRNLPRNIDRPFKAENTTENLVNQVDSEPNKLNAWLHQNYPRFSDPNDMEKVALFMENLSYVDTMSLDSTQSTQYYESHKSIDLVQKHVAIEATVFSLYKDTSMDPKKSGDKKLRDAHGYEMMLKSSVASNPSMKGDTGLHGFDKPTSLMVSKISEDHRALLDRFSSKMTRIFNRPYEQNDLLLDYAPYMKILLDKPVVSYRHSYTNLPAAPVDSQVPDWTNHRHIRTIIKEIDKIDDPMEVDYNQKHETLMELIDQCDSQKVKIGTELENRDTPMSD